LRPKKRIRSINHLQRAARDVSSLDTHVVLSQVRRLRDRLQRAIVHPPTTNRARHLLRINVKKARYVLEATGRPVTPLVKLQDHLGRWHDLMVLSSVAGRTSQVTRARNREWMIARRLVRPALRRAIHSLADLRAQGVLGVAPNKCLAGKTKCVSKKIGGYSRAAPIEQPRQVRTTADGLL
jgi:CHAD domain-containing protein